MTMRFEVWHARNPTFDRYVREDSPANPNRQRQRFPQDYDKVAVVEADDVDQVFSMTNHIEDSWTKNRGVLELPMGQAVRSTSVGDVVVCPDGKKMYCEPTGWTEIR